MCRAPRAQELPSLQMGTWPTSPDSGGWRRSALYLRAATVTLLPTLQEPVSAHRAAHQPVKVWGVHQAGCAALLQERLQVGPATVTELPGVLGAGGGPSSYQEGSLGYWELGEEGFQLSGGLPGVLGAGGRPCYQEGGWSQLCVLTAPPARGPGPGWTAEPHPMLAAITQPPPSRGTGQ